MQIDEGMRRHPEDGDPQDFQSAVLSRSLFDRLRSPVELAFALIIGVLCGLSAILGVLLLRIILG